MKTLDEAVKKARFRALVDWRDLDVVLLTNGEFAVRSDTAHLRQFTGALHVAHVRRVPPRGDQTGWFTEVDYII